LDDKKGSETDLRDQIKLLREEIRDEVRSAMREARESNVDSREGSIRVDIGRGDLGDAEPSSVIAKDLVKLIRDNVRSSLVEKGERAVDDLVSGMPEGTAADVLKSLANIERIRIVKLLYSSDRTFSEMKASTNLEAASVSHHLKSLLRMGLVAHVDEGGYQLTKRGRLLVRSLALMNEALGGESID
jgi:DNA-binding transcriptional ArsR family regulator